MRFKNRTRMALILFVLACSLGGCNGASGSADTATTTSTSPPTVSPLPPRTNAVWVYDPKDRSGQVNAGAYVDAIQQYNRTANQGHRIREIYSYGGDMEMYCPGNIVAACTSNDFYVFYSRDAVVYNGLPGKHSNASAVAYAQGLISDLLSGPPIVAPIIDGTVTGSGALVGFNDLSPSQARAFADKVAWRLCGDPIVAGVEFDLEPFNVGTANGQYYFYLQIAKDFASSEMSCVDSAHPQGRFFAIFASSNALKPGTTSSRRVAQIMNSRHNGYWIDPLYDLSSKPAGYRTSVDQYRSLAVAHAYNTTRWADLLGIKYQFGIPGAASFHEYATCSGSACTGAAGPPGGQLDYVMAAENAIDGSYARNDPLFLGTVLWSWSPRVGFGDTQFDPTAPPSSVGFYLGGLL